MSYIHPLDLTLYINEVNTLMNLLPMSTILKFSFYTGVHVGIHGLSPDVITHNSFVLPGEHFPVEETYELVLQFTHL